MVHDDNVLILYHSGAGSTKMLAEVYFERLKSYNIDIKPINLSYEYSTLLKYDFFIFAFPTYHCEPSTSMMEFIKGMPGFKQQKRAFVFTTCGLYSGNSVRSFIRECIKKNVVVCGSSVYRAPATDGSLLLPPFSFMFEYENNIICRIGRDIGKIHEIIENNNYGLYCPAFKLYTILNFPNKVLGKAYKHNLRVFKDYCINCRKCIDNCIRHCWKIGKEYPEHDLRNCEFCFKCIHHCPNNAIGLSKRTKQKPKLNSNFYHKIKEKMLEEHCER